MNQLNKNRLKKKGISTSYTYVDGEDFSETIKISMQSLNAAFFKPNTLFISINTSDLYFNSYQKIIEEAKRNEYAVLLYVPYENVGLSLEKDIQLWLKNFLKVSTLPFQMIWFILVQKI